MAVNWKKPPAASNDVIHRLSKDVYGAKTIRRGLTAVLLGIGVTTLGSVGWSLHNATTYWRVDQTIGGTQEIFASARLLSPSDIVAGADPVAPVGANRDAAPDVGILMGDAKLPPGWIFSNGKLIDPFDGVAAVALDVAHTPRRLVITLAGIPDSVCAGLAAGLIGDTAMTAHTLRIGDQEIPPAAGWVSQYPIAAGDQRSLALIGSLCHSQEVGGVDTLSVFGSS